MNKVLITGASGLLGREIYKEAIKYNFEAIGLALTRTGENFIKCDLTNDKKVEELLERIKPNFIIHAAAERFPNKVENEYEKTRILNIETSRKLSQIAKKFGSRIIYISTDYVFDGSSPPYSIEDTPNPLNKYGQTKYEGEQAIMEENEYACIIRIPILYGDVEYLEESAVTSLLNLLLSCQPKTVSHYERRYPSHTTDIAKIICDLILKICQDKSLRGIFHWSGKEKLTKYEMVLAMGQVLFLPSDHIKPDETPTAGAQRPFDSKLDNARLESIGISHHTQFSDGIKECLTPWISLHHANK